MFKKNYNKHHCCNPQVKKQNQTKRVHCIQLPPANVHTLVTCENHYFEIVFTTAMHIF